MAGIIGMEYVLPEEILTNEQLAQLYTTWSAEKIYQKTGIHTRHVVNGETALDLAECAVDTLLNKNGINKNEIDFLIYVTQSPEYIMPSSACVLQDRVQLHKGIGALDVNLGCSGYIYGLALANGLIESNMAKNVLLVTADTYSRYIHSMDRSTRTIFGDGATATLIGEGGWQIGRFDFGTDGKGKDAFIIPAGGMKKPRTDETCREYEQDGNIRTEEHIYMDGPEIFDFTIREIPKSVNRLLEKEHMKLDEVDLVVFHQANQFMLDFLRKTMKVDRERFYMNFSDIGNTVSSSIPIALKRVMNDDIINKVNTILISGFGVGLSWGTTILRREE